MIFEQNNLNILLPYKKKWHVDDAIGYLKPTTSTTWILLILVTDEWAAWRHKSAFRIDCQILL